jgi:hypothetical protein
MRPDDELELLAGGLDAYLAGDEARRVEFPSALQLQRAAQGHDERAQLLNAMREPPDVLVGGLTVSRSRPIHHPSQLRLTGVIDSRQARSRSSRARVTGIASVAIARCSAPGISCTGQLRAAALAALCSLGVGALAQLAGSEPLGTLSAASSSADVRRSLTERSVASD